MAVTDTNTDVLTIAGTELRSRLLLGTGGFRSLDALAGALEVSGSELVTVALRRIDPSSARLDRRRARPRRRQAAAQHRGLLHRPRRRPDRQARPRGVRDGLGQARGRRRRAHAPPGRPALLEAAEELVDDGFVVLPYTNDDPILARRLEDVGCAAVMPLGSPIGSGMGLLNPYNLRLIRERAGVPVILDAGIGTASDAALAMELGYDAVLCATAISRAEEPETWPARSASASRAAASPTAPAASPAASTPRPPPRRRASPSSKRRSRVKGPGPFTLAQRSALTKSR